MGAYTREQQLEDIRIVSRTLDMISGRVIGDYSAEVEGYLTDYIRIARYFVKDTYVMRSVAKMFRTIVESPRLSGLHVAEYEELLTVVLRHVKKKLQRRRPKNKACLLPDIHRQPCYCGNLAAFQETEKFTGMAARRED